MTASYVAGELDTLISDIPHSHLVMAPVFGAPAAADIAQLVIVMAGDYRSKKEVAHLLVPAMGRKVIDLGGNLEKGMCRLVSYVCQCVTILCACSGVIVHVLGVRSDRS